MTDQLTLEGYRPGLPPWCRTRNANIDALVAAEAECSVCGRHGLRLAPYYRLSPRSYRAFAVCPDCGDRQEF